MKPFLYTIVLLVIATSTVLSVAASAQSIVTQAITTSELCNGNKVLVSYTATGPFNADNDFIIQLSNKDGGFTSGWHYHIGSVRATASGEIEGILSGLIEPGSNYRIRVVSTSPAIIGTDNGSDLNMYVPNVRINVDGVIALSGRDIQLEMLATGVPPGAEYVWDFGAGASPQSSTAENPPTIRYTEVGRKRITLTISRPGHCLFTFPFDIKVSTLLPSIDDDAAIVTAEGIINPLTDQRDARDLWVCPGGSYIQDGRLWAPNTVVESGGSIRVNDIFTGDIYLKSGAALQLAEGASLGGFIFYEDAADIVKPEGLEVQLMQVDEFEFNYSDAPIGGCPAPAAYTVFVEINDVELIDGVQQEDEATNTTFWVKGSAALTLTGDNNRILLEPGAVLTVNGANNTIYLKNQATASISGSAHRIFSEPDAAVENTSDGSGYFPAEKITYISNTAADVVEEAARQHGCVSVYPNPATRKIAISSGDKATTILSVRVFDMIGQTVYTQSLTQEEHTKEVSIVGWPAGMYAVAIRTIHGLETHILHVQ